MVKLRKMIFSDINVVASLYYESFWDKMVALKNISKNDAVNLIKIFLFSNDHNFNHYTVATINDEPVGFIKLMKKTDKDKYSMPSLQTFRKYGFFKLILTGIVLSFLEWKVKDGELYIETVAVSSEERGKGIGSTLMKHADDVVINNESLKYLSLGVVHKNKDAKRLYERLGFVTKKIETSKLLKRYADIEAMYYMVKKIKRD